MKRLISAILCLVMILGMVPAVSLLHASAAESDTYTIVQENPVTIASSSSGAKYEWYKNNGYADSADNYMEIVAEGYNDAGALHVYQADAAITDMQLALYTDWITEGTYTLKMYVKGDLGGAEQTNRFYTAGSDSLFSNLNVLAGTYDVSNWTEVTQTVELTAGASYFIYSFSKYNWATDMYIDNVQLVNSNGVDVLSGAGSFCTKETVTVEMDGTVEAKTLHASDPSTKYEWYKNNGYTDSEQNYIEIVADGYANMGSLHVYQADTTVTDMQLALYTDWISEGTYTLKMYVKGDLGGAEQTNRFYTAGSDSLFSNLNALAGTYDVSDWTEVTQTVEITSGASYFIYNFSKYNWATDMYIDNVQLLNSNGEDVLGGAGSFCAEVEKTPELLTIHASDPSTKYEWYKNNGYADSADNYMEIVAEGYNDAGALHVYQADTTVTDMQLALYTDWISEGTYTLKMYVKGDLGGAEQTNRFYTAGSDSLFSNLNVLAGTYDVSDWTEVSQTVEITSGASYFIYNFSKYNWATDMYVDNVQLVNSSGVDVLSGAGSFCVAEEEEPTEPATTVPEPTEPATTVPEPTEPEPTVPETTEPEIDGTLMTIHTSDPGTKYEWYKNNGYADSADNYMEIVAEGYNDAGALHVYQADTTVTDMQLALCTDWITEGTYTLKMYVKGDLGGKGQTNKFYPVGSDGLITNIHDSLGVDEVSDWTEVTQTVELTSGASYFIYNFSKYNWATDMYVDNVQLVSSSGEDVLRGAGSFYIPAEEPAPEIPDLAVISSAAERAFRWYWNGSYTASDNNLVEVVEDGSKDPGALHIWQNTAASNVNIAMITSMASDLDSGSYTLKLDVKGSFVDNGETFAVYTAYMTEEQIAAMNIKDKLVDVAGTTNVTDWTTLTWTLPHPTDTSEGNGFTYLILNFSQYNWETDVYIDNIQVLDPDGNDVLGGAGSFLDSGSESWPITVYPGCKVLNSNTLYYTYAADSVNLTVSNATEKYLGVTYTLGDQNFSMAHNGTTQAASSAKATMNMAAQKDGLPVVFSLTSTESLLEGSASDYKEVNLYDITCANVVDSAVSPETLTLGTHELGFVWGDSNGYYYTYTASAKGTLNVDVESGNVTPVLSTDDSGDTGSLDVDAGEVVTVQIIANQDDDGAYVATDAVINVSFTEYVCTHSNTTTSTVDATCTAAGSTTVSCSECGEIISVTEIPVADHSYGDWTVSAPATMSASGLQQRVCAVCGDTQEETIPCLAGDVESWSLTLGSDLCVNFRVVIPTAISDSAQVSIAVASGEAVVYDLADCGWVESAENGDIYEVSVHVAAAQMQDEIKVKILHDGDASVEKTYTVEDYAYSVLGNEEMSGYHQLVMEMLNYGAAAQLYFDYNVSEYLPTYELSKYGSYGETDIPEAAEHEMVASGTVDGVSFYAASLVHNNKVAVRLYFKVEGNVEDYVFSTTLPDAESGIEASPVELVQSGDYYYAEFTGIAPNAWNDPVHLYVIKGEQNISVEYSPMNYIVRMNNKAASGDTLKALLKAMYNYHLAAFALNSGN